MMQVLALASRKGGSGKTTLSGHIAVQAERAGAGPVAVMDLDPQGSLAEWWNSRNYEQPLFVKTSIDRLRKEMAELRRMGIELLVIDTPPSLSTEVRTVIENADLVLVPTRPSPHDLRSVGATVELVESLGKPMIFVVNGATPRARITEEAIAALSQHGPIAPVVVHQRVDFASSMIDGRTVMELQLKTRSSEEIVRLWEFLETRLTGTNNNALSRFVNRLWYDKAGGKASNGRIQGVS